MISGSCHCGKSAFRIEAEMPQSLTRCTCSFCSKRGVLWAYFQPAQFHLTSSADNDATYRWNTKLVAHHFCPVCGCGTFTDSPAFEPDGSWDKHTRRIGVNARLFASKIVTNLYIRLTKSDLSPQNRVALSDKSQFYLFSNVVYLFYKSSNGLLICCKLFVLT